jgi:hypothetical protein
LQVTGGSNLNTVSSSQYNTGTYKGTTGSATNVNVSGTTTTVKLVSSQSALGAASSNSFDVTGLLSAAGMTVTTANVLNAGTISTISGTTATATTINGNTFNGGVFYGSDFISSTGGSENQIRIDLDKRKAELDNCMYVTEYCMPKAPTVSISCVNCTWSKADTSFSATVTATISQCRHGCTYSWSISGVSGSCPSGTVPAGGSRTVTCTVSGTAAADQTKTGTVSLTASNSVKTTLKTTKSVSINWRNTQPVNPVGCFYDANNYYYIYDYEQSDYGDNEITDYRIAYKWQGAIVYSRDRYSNPRSGEFESNESGSTDDGAYRFTSGSVAEVLADESYGTGGYFYEAYHQICRVAK